jgi:5-methyltetrahydropteroyltriglutamate--homocysteine methyltransferase
MSRRSLPPFRADQVGSLLRPPELLEARARHQAGELSDDELRQTEDEAIRGAVKKQESIGLQSATDGEFRRASWHMDFLTQLGGVTKVTDTGLVVHFRNATGQVDAALPSVHIDARIHLEHPIFADAFRFLQETVTTATPKLTIPSPSMLHYRGGRASIDPALYPDLDQFWEDLSGAYRDEIAALAAQGCTYLQLDDTSLAYLNDPAQRAMLAGRGDDAEHQHLRYIRQINKALEGRPDSLRVTTHMCRGNFRSSWTAEGGYDFVAEALFNELGVDGFFCEWDDERSGGFEPLRFVPKGKRVVLGLVTTKRGDLEGKDQLKRRIEDAARFVDIDQLCLSPQCGFSSTKEGNDLSQQQQWDKLRLIVETAQEVWGPW